LKNDHHVAAVAALIAAKRDVLRLIYRGPVGADRRPLTEVVDAIDRAVNAIRAERPGTRDRVPGEVRVVGE
jgi:hypothetical protein